MYSRGCSDPTSLNLLAASNTIRKPSTAMKSRSSVRSIVRSGFSPTPLDDSGLSVITLEQYNA
jgi:hypothetical protein